MLLQVPGGSAAGGGSLVLGSDIIYLKPAPAHWIRTEGARRRVFLLLSLHAMAPLALAGLFFATRRRNQLTNNIALARRQKAPRSARAALRKAEAALRTSGTPSAVFDPLAAAVFDYFGHRLNLPPGAVDSALLHAKFSSAQIPDADLAKWQAFFALSDQIRYAKPPELSRNELAEWISTVTTLLRQAERIKL